ncbi:MAG: Gfo/Idh/MocA family oxidoreductase [Actinomycetota bacterium]|nr:Gfo/Idh/MocA family oxidoreductase [Actinomycetota bacterium]
MTKPVIKVAFVGGGWMARAHARAIASINVLGMVDAHLELSSILTRDPSKVGALASLIGFTKGVATLEEIVDDEDIEIVAVLSPTQDHFRTVSALLESGKTLLVEKPLTTDLVTSNQLAAMLHSGSGSDINSIAAVGYNYRFVPAVELMRDLVLQGKIGRVRQFRGRYDQSYALDRAKRKGWRFEDFVGGSSVGDYSHLVDLAHRFVGDFDVSYSQLWSFSDSDNSLRRISAGEASEDSFFALGSTESQVVTLAGGRIHNGRDNFLEIEVEGEEGTLIWNLEDMNKLKLFQRSHPNGSTLNTDGFREVLVSDLDHPFMERWWGSGHTLGWADTFVHEWSELVQCHIEAETNFPALASFEEAAQVQRSVDLIRELA